jgi:hypothetical protein
MVGNPFLAVAQESALCHDATSTLTFSKPTKQPEGSYPEKLPAEAIKKASSGF